MSFELDKAAVILQPSQSFCIISYDFRYSTLFHQQILTCHILRKDTIS